jgi:hypothetical protein
MLILNIGARCHAPASLATGKIPVLIVEEARWVSWPVWMGTGKEICLNKYVLDNVFT